MRRRKTPLYNDLSERIRVDILHPTERCSDKPKCFLGSYEVSSVSKEPIQMAEAYVVDILRDEESMQCLKKWQISF